MLGAHIIFHLLYKKRIMRILVAYLTIVLLGLFYR
jgi:hypothetical protein